MNPAKKVISLSSRKKREFIDITTEIQEYVRKSGLLSGTVLVYCPHTTAGITINENADPDVLVDIDRYLAESVPDMPDFRHAEGNSSAHIMAALFSSQTLIVVTDGALELGRWQGVFFCEFDGPRMRNVILKVVSAD